ncbi:MAG TPA: S41 family peptidase [Pirellulales bacterium]|nr:S41 family peptidase [Pirellulales bacterium]
MPRQNLVVLVIAAVVSIVCFRQADSAHRSEYGRMYDTFAEVLKEVDAYYLRKVENQQLFEGALQGIMGRLDPYSAYIGPDQFAEFVATLEQRFGGVGIEVTINAETGALEVTTPLADSPAFAAGVRAGDIIKKIDGRSTEGLVPDDIDEIVGRLRGRQGVVQLTVMHKGETEPVEISIGRAMIPVDSVLGDARDAENHWDFFLAGEERIGYVRIANFGENTERELNEALAWLAERNVRGLILDLRNNRGGVFDQAVATCDLFLKEGRIVSTRGRDGVEIKAEEASGNAPYAELPLVVLVNQHTASAAEIVAACLQDHGRAIVVGQRTYGKGTVQNVIRLEGGRSLLKLTTASYWRPSGQDIHRYPDIKDQEHWGVQPNAGYEVPLDEAATNELARRRHQRDVIRAGDEAPPAVEQPPEVATSEDPQLKRALEALTALLAR